MKLDTIFEVYDMRDEPTLGVFGSPSAIPGGLCVTDINGYSVDLEIDDDYPDALTDNEEAGILDLRTEQGRVLLVELTVANWPQAATRWDVDTPEFKSDAELQTYFRSRMV